MAEIFDEASDIVECPRCHGDGLIAGYTEMMKCVPEECDRCGGHGLIAQAPADTLKANGDHNDG